MKKLVEKYLLTPRQRARLRTNWLKSKAQIYDVLIERTAEAQLIHAIPIIAEEIKGELEKQLTTRNEVDVADKRVKPHYKMHITADWWHTFWKEWIR